MNVFENSLGHQSEINFHLDALSMLYGWNILLNFLAAHSKKSFAINTQFVLI